MRLCLLPLLLAAALAGPAVAQTGGVQVTPVIIAMAPESGLASLRVRNWREHEVAFEVEVLSWRQEDGEDVLSSTSELVAAPSVFAIAPAEEQIIRLARAPGSAPPQRELSYRLLIRELPSPARDASGFRVELHMSLPVFVSPRPALAEIAARRVIRHGADPGIVLENTGSAHVRLASANFGEDDHPLERLPRYLLAGATITRPAPPEAASIVVVYAGADDPTPIAETLPLDRPLALLRSR